MSLATISRVHSANTNFSCNGFFWVTDRSAPRVVARCHHERTGGGNRRSRGGALIEIRIDKGACFAAAGRYLYRHCLVLV